MSTIIHIVDDDPQVGAATSYLLAGHGYDTRLHASGAALLSNTVLEEGCILLDQQMPGLSGLEVLAQLRRRAISLPVIMMSGHAELAVATQAIKLGAEDFLEKPWRERDLIAAVERALATGARSRNRTEDRAAAQARLERLSPRERQVLQGLLAGLANKEIARRLSISPRTVEMHRANMMADLGTDNLPQVLRLAVDAEVTPLDGAISDEPIGRAAEPFRSSGMKRRRSTVADTLPSALDVLEGATDCVFLLDANWRLVYLNRNAVATIAQGRDIVGTVLWDAFPLAVDTVAWDHLRRAAADRCEVRFTFFEPDLESWFDVSVRPIPIGLQVFFRDVTSERRAEAALRLSEASLHLALDASGHGAWDWNITTGQIAMSPRFLARLGYSVDMVAANIEGVTALVHPNDRKRLKDALDDHLLGRTDSFACEYRLRRSNGEWCWNFDRGRIIERDRRSGAPTRMVGTASDVTDRKNDEIRAQEAYDRIGLAQRNAGAGTWDLDLTSRRVRLCASSAAMHGLSGDQERSLSEDEWEATVHPDDLQAVHLALEDAIAGWSTYRAQYRTMRPDGVCGWVLGLGKLVVDGMDGSCRFVGLNLDMTDAVNAAMELKHTQAELVHLSRLGAMGGMASTLAHELSQPVSAISNYIAGIRLSMDKLKGGCDAPILAAVDGVERSAAHASQVLRRLRESASGAQEPRIAESLGDIVRTACELSASGQAPQLTPSVDVDAAADAIFVDRIQIEQVLLNLIKNGREAMIGADDAMLAITARKDGAFARVEVRDSGSGVPSALKEQLFSPLASSKAGGAGIGLSICRTIVEAHGGRIWLADDAFGGSCFCFTVPLAAP